MYIIEDDHIVMFVSSFFSKRLGRRVYASEYGKKAIKLRFPIGKFRSKKNVRANKAA